MHWWARRCACYAELQLLPQGDACRSIEAELKKQRIDREVARLEASLDPVIATSRAGGSVRGRPRAAEGGTALALLKELTDQLSRSVMDAAVEAHVRGCLLAYLAPPGGGGRRQRRAAAAYDTAEARAEAALAAYCRESSVLQAAREGAEAARGGASVSTAVRRPPEEWLASLEQRCNGVEGVHRLGAALFATPGYEQLAAAALQHAGEKGEFLSAVLLGNRLRLGTAAVPKDAAGAVRLLRLALGSFPPASFQQESRNQVGGLISRRTRFPGRSAQRAVGAALHACPVLRVQMPPALES